MSKEIPQVMLDMIDYLNKYLRNKEILILSLMSLADSKIVKYCNTNNIKVCQKWLWFSNYIKEKLTFEDEPKDNEGGENQ